MTSGQPTLLPARVRDLPVLALVTGAAMATRPFGRWLRWPLAVLSWPAWFFLLWVSTPYMWRIGHRATITIRPPDAPTRPTRLRVSGALLVLFALELLAYALLPTNGLVWVLLLVMATFVVVFLGPYPGRLPAGPPVSHPAPPVLLSTAASVRRGSGLLTATRDLIDRTWPDAPIEAVARSRDLVPLYEELWGLTQVNPDCGRMVSQPGRSGGPTPAG